MATDIYYLSGINAQQQPQAPKSKLPIVLGLAGAIGLWFYSRS